MRAVLDLPLGPTLLRSPGVMVNVIGAEPRAAAFDAAAALAEVPDAHVHLYGKAEERPRRKMGHVTVLGADLAVARDRAGRAVRALLSP